MHKTGSTSIQNALSSKSFDEFHYLRLDEPNHSIALYTLFADDPSGHHLLRLRGMSAEEIARYREKYLASLKDQVANCNRNLVISGEVLSLPGHIGILKKLKKLIEPFFSEIEVIGYVRPPVGFAQSDFQESVKGGECFFSAERKFPAYRQRFEPIDELFGRENVTLVKFSSSNLKNGDVVSDFLSRLGINRDVEITTRDNESLSLEAVALLYAYQKYCKEAGRPIERVERAGLLKWLGTVGSRKVLFGARLVELMVRNNSAQISWIEDRVGGSFSETRCDAAEGFNTEAELLKLASAVWGSCLEGKTCCQQAGTGSKLLEASDFQEWLAKSVGMDFTSLNISEVAERYGVSPHVLLRELARALAGMNKLEAALELLDEALRLQPSGVGIKQLKEDISRKLIA